VLLEFGRIEEPMVSKKEPAGSKEPVESKQEPVESKQEPVESKQELVESKQELVENKQELVDCMLGLENCIPVPVASIQEQGGCIPVLEASIQELVDCIQEQKDCCNKEYRILGVLLGHRKTKLPDVLHTVAAPGTRTVEHRKKEVKHTVGRNTVGSHRECESGCQHRVRARVHDRDCGHDDVRVRVHRLQLRYVCQNTSILAY
jgi:hypothetical protein